MSSNPSKENVNLSNKWLHPNEVMQLHRFKVRKKQLQARFNKTVDHIQKSSSTEEETAFCNTKRKNPFITNDANKKLKSGNSFDISEESSDQLLFKLLHFSKKSAEVPEDVSVSSNSKVTQELLTAETVETKQPNVEGKEWIPIDWSLKTKLRFMSEKPLAWNQKLKNSEEASGITGFVRCLDTTTKTSLDTSTNARFHQCCLYWQQPSLPWLNLFPRLSSRGNINNGAVTITPVVRQTLQSAWIDSFRSLFQLLRTLQCPYFYVCANAFTILFRAVGICGYSDIHAFVTPTTRGFRNLLEQEDIEFTMPLKAKNSFNQKSDRSVSVGNDTTIDAEIPEDEEDEEWLQSMGINAEDIKQINYTQERIKLKTECKVDKSEQSLVYVKGVDVNALYNFLINCKSTTAATGPTAGIPPTLLAPVAYHGATLCALKVRENKVHIDNSDYYSLELNGPILPHTIHSLSALHPSENNLTATFASVSSTLSFNKVVDNLLPNEQTTSTSTTAFGKENLSDCGLNPNILKHFCNSDSKRVASMECLKYTAKSGLYTWS